MVAQLFISILVVCLLFTSEGYAQLYDNNTSTVYEQLPPFNAKFIGKNKIKQIQGKLFNKKTGDVMRLTDDEITYHFNEQGQLIHRLEIVSTNNFLDTISEVYQYNSKGKISKKIKNLHDKFHAYSYSYDTSNYITRIETYEALLTNNNLHFPEFEMDTLIDFETMRYKIYTPTQRKKIVYNSYGNPYLDEIYYSNKEGQIIEIAKKLKITSEINETKFTYTPSNLIDSMYTYSSVTPQEIESHKYIYDKQNNLIYKKNYKNKELITQTDYIYNATTKMLSSIIIQDVATNFLKIIRFETSYWE